MIISEFESGDSLYTVKFENGVYNVYLDDKVVQPNHDANGVIRYLSLIAHNLFYLNEKLKNSEVQKAAMPTDEERQLFRDLVQAYTQDVIGKSHWLELDTTDETVALRQIFLEGACFDFSTALSELANWPVYEVQWGTAKLDDPTECEDSDWGVHRIVLHPSGRYLDASGWTDQQGVLTRVQRQDATYHWMGQVDAECGTFDVDYELVKKAVVALLPPDVCLPKVS